MHEESTEVAAGACRYLLVGLLPRLEQLRPGLLAEIGAGISGDRDAMAKAGTLTPQVDAVVNEALRIVALGGRK